MQYTPVHYHGCCWWWISRECDEVKRWSSDTIQCLQFILSRTVVVLLIRSTWAARQLLQQRRRRRQGAGVVKMHRSAVLMLLKYSNEIKYMSTNDIVLFLHCTIHTDTEIVKQQSTIAGVLVVCILSEEIKLKINSSIRKIVVWYYGMFL